MQPAAEKLQIRLADIKLSVPTVPVVNNVDVAEENSAVKISDALVRQAAAPVRWVEIMRHMQVGGVTHVIECGPGKVLSGVAKRCAEGLMGISMSDLSGVEAALAVVKE